MDDQSNPNQTLDQGVSSGVTPPVPPVSANEPVEDITPATEPITAPAPKPMTPFAPTPMLEPEETSPQPEPMAPFSPPVAMPVPESPTIPSPVPSPIPSEPTPPVAPETPMPQGKPKKKILPVIGGVLALLLVVGVAGAAYYVSNQLSTRQAVAPTAPESKPLAGYTCTWKSCVSGKCATRTQYMSGTCPADDCTGCDAPLKKTCSVKGCVTGKCATHNVSVLATEDCPADDCTDCDAPLKKVCPVKECVSGTCATHDVSVLATESCPVNECSTVGAACSA
jgi:hypothetical protein